MYNGRPFYEGREELLSKQERRFVISPNSFPKKYQYVFRIRLRKKIEDTRNDLLFCIENQQSMGIDVSAMCSGIFHTGSGISDEKSSDEKISDDKPKRAYSVADGNRIAEDGEPEF